MRTFFRPLQLHLRKHRLASSLLSSGSKAARYSALGSVSSKPGGGHHAHFNAVNALIFANIVVFGGATYLASPRPWDTSYWMGDPFFWRTFVDRHLYLSNSRIAKKRYETLITHAFMHADLPHLAMNMLALHSFGGTTLFLLGGPRFLALYFGSAVAGAAAQLAYFRYVPRMDIPASRRIYSHSSVCGASAAIAGLVAYTCAAAPTSQVLVMLIIPMKMRTFLAGFLAISGYCAYYGVGGYFAHAAHIGGSLAGLAFFAATRGRRLLF